MRALIIFLFPISLTVLYRPCSADTICDAKKFGALADGKTKDTKALQRAIDSCSISGGVVDLHDGVFLSGMITLKTNVTLRIESSATLKGTTDDSDYPTLNPATDNSQLVNCRKALIFAEGAHHIAIDGSGTIDGSGENPAWVGKEATRPMAIFIALSSSVVIQGIHVKNAGMWSVVTMETDHILIQNIDVNSPFGPTRDGIDIVDCHHVLIRNCRVFSEDDAFCLKSGNIRGVYDVTIRDSEVLQSSVANGLKLGTASTGSFKKVLFDNITIQNVDKAAMAVESVDGAAIDDVRFNNIRFHQAGSAVFVILGKRGKIPSVGSIQNISFMDIAGETKHPWGSAISGTLLDGVTYDLTNLSFENVHITAQGGLRSIPSDPPEYAGQYPDPNLWGNLPASGYFIRHVRGISFVNSSIQVETPDERQTVIQRDVYYKLPLLIADGPNLS